jgi:hypothetical protein
MEAEMIDGGPEQAPDHPTMGRLSQIEGDVKILGLATADSPRLRQIENVTKLILGEEGGYLVSEEDFDGTLLPLCYLEGGEPGVVVEPQPHDAPSRS